MGNEKKRNFCVYNYNNNDNNNNDTNTNTNNNNNNNNIPVDLYLSAICQLSVPNWKPDPYLTLNCQYLCIRLSLPVGNVFRF